MNELSPRHLIPSPLGRNTSFSIRQESDVYTLHVISQLSNLQSVKDKNHK